MPVGVTTTSREVYELHMLILWICVIIGAGVYGAMIMAIVRFRKSKGAVAAKWTHNGTAEVIWTVIPAVILVAMAVPAAETLIRMEDTREWELTIQVTGYQWRWRYDYIDEDVGFFSTLDRESNAARRVGSGVDPSTVENYLLAVDNEVVVPVDTKVRLLITAADVLHAWWVPAFAVKKDAVPGSSTKPGSRPNGGHVSRPVRRALRHGPRVHADRRAPHEPRRVRHVAEVAACASQRGGSAMTAVGSLGRTPLRWLPRERTTQQGSFGMKPWSMPQSSAHWPRYVPLRISREARSFDCTRAPRLS